MYRHHTEQKIVTARGWYGERRVTGYGFTQAEAHKNLIVKIARLVQLDQEARARQIEAHRAADKVAAKIVKANPEYDWNTAPAV